LVCAACGLNAVGALRRLDLPDLAERRYNGGCVRVGAFDQQRSVNVEEQQQRCA
jgi:hypothetical protein